MLITLLRECEQVWSTSFDLDVPDVETPIVPDLPPEIALEPELPPEATGYVDYADIPVPTPAPTVDPLYEANMAAAAAESDVFAGFEEIPPDLFAQPDPTQGTQADVARGKPSPFGFTPEQQRAIGHWQRTRSGDCGTRCG